MQENKDNRQKWAEWAKKAQAKARALYEKIKTMDKEEIRQVWNVLRSEAKTKLQPYIEELKVPENKATRWRALRFSAVLGLACGVVINFLGLLKLVGLGADSHGKASVIILIVSLPILALLWWFRTYDTRQQIQKTQETINVNLFGMYQKMLRAKKKEERSSGLLGLMGMKHKGLFEEEIDFITQQSLDLDEMVFNHMNLSGAKLCYASMKKAGLRETNLSDADLRHANISGSDLREARLNYALLMNAILQESVLCRAKLMGASLHAADLRGANLSSADLSGAYLNDAFLYGAKLVEADLSGADLSGAKLIIPQKTEQPDNAFPFEREFEDPSFINAELVGAKYNKETKFPDGFDPEVAGMKLVERPHHRKPNDEGTESE